MLEQTTIFIDTTLMDNDLLNQSVQNPCIELLEVQPEGKKRMDITSFINGYKPAEGTVLG